MTGVVVAVTVASSLLVTSPAAADHGRPHADLPFVYHSGLEPGSLLAGRVLPMDWSTRVSPCPTNGARLLLTAELGGRPPLCPGDASPAVVRLQWLLAEKGLFRAPFTGVYDEATRYAVVTFHKLIGPARTDPRTARADWMANPPPEDWTEEDWEMLDAFEPRPPKLRRGQPDRVEVDIGRQVLYLIEDHRVAAIMPVSTGAGPGTVSCVVEGCGLRVTPRTSRWEQGSTFYYEHRFTSGWSPRPGIWSIHKAIFYRGQHGEWNYGIHGYRDVPSYPTSFGCIRVTVWDMDWLRPWATPGVYDVEAARVRVGMPIHVWDA